MIFPFLERKGKGKFELVFFIGGKMGLERLARKIIRRKTYRINVVCMHLY